MFIRYCVSCHDHFDTEDASEKFCLPCKLSIDEAIQRKIAKRKANQAMRRYLLK